MTRFGHDNRSIFNDESLAAVAAVAAAVTIITESQPEQAEATLTEAEAQAASEMNSPIEVADVAAARDVSPSAATMAKTIFFMVNEPLKEKRAIAKASGRFYPDSPHLLASNLSRGHFMSST